MERAKVMIVDDHPLFRQGLRRALEREKSLEMAGEAADGLEAIRMALDMKPHIILMDINLPSLNGLQVTKELREALPDTVVIMLTAYHDEEQSIHAMKAGASAYFPKEVTPQRLIWAIKEVMKGNRVIGDKTLTGPEADVWLAGQMEKLTTGSTEEAQFIPLSPREMEILQHAARGESNKEIARVLEISQQTVKNHISSILRKLPARDRTEAAIYALRHGWIRLVDTKRED